MLSDDFDLVGLGGAVSLGKTLVFFTNLNFFLIRDKENHTNIRTKVHSMGCMDLSNNWVVKIVKNHTNYHTAVISMFTDSGFE